MKKRIRVLIVDDHAMMRLGLAQAIAREPDLLLVGEAGNGEDAIQLYGEKRPDVVIMDFKLPGLDGSESTLALRAKYPNARVVLLSIYEGSEDIWRATQAGAVGYVSKSVEVAEVIAAVRQAAEGQSYFSTGLEEKLASRSIEASLTQRELDVLHQMVAGRSNKEIAASLYMSQAAVKYHLNHIFTKLHVADRTQATAAAVRRGIVHLDG